MAKLYYKFGVMGSSKTANALMVKFNYEEKDQTFWLIKPATDTRDNKTVNGRTLLLIKSRIGLSAEAEAIDDKTDIYKLFALRSEKSLYKNVVIADESQFFTEEQIEQLKRIADLFDVPVLCYGLRTDFQTKLFPGSRRLFEIADSISEIKSICHCGRKATVNARFDENGKIVIKGAQVLLGGNNTYTGMCYKCYNDLVEASEHMEV